MRMNNAFKLAYDIFCLLLFSLSLLFFSRLALWGRGLRTDRVSIIAPPCMADLFNNNQYFDAWKLGGETDSEIR